MSDTTTWLLDESTEKRFWPKVKITESCWEWIGARDTCGYGRFWLGGRVDGAHRVSYEAHIAPIPEGKEIDHLCRNRACVNPSHLEAVTRRTNVRRAAAQITHCPQGHEYTPDNTVLSSSGKGSMGRKCRTCRNGYFRQYSRARSAARKLDRVDRIAGGAS